MLPHSPRVKLAGVTGGRIAFDLQQAGVAAARLPPSMTRKESRKAYGTIAIGVAIIATSCASGAGRPSRQLTPFPVVERTERGCGPATLPLQIPPLAAILDAASLEAASAARALPHEQAVVSIVFDAWGGRPYIKVLASDLDARQATVLVAILDSLVH